MICTCGRVIHGRVYRDAYDNPVCNVCKSYKMPKLSYPKTKLR